LGAAAPICASDFAAFALANAQLAISQTLVDDFLEAPNSWSGVATYFDVTADGRPDKTSSKKARGSGCAAEGSDQGRIG
jgi:hypothetical protein